jgi:hypothetical protein
MNKIRIVKNGITRLISEKDSAKWGARGYKRVDAVADVAKPKATKAK